MIKKAGIFISKLLLVALVALVVSAAVYTRLNRVNITNSLVDNTPIGSVTPSTGVFTTATANTQFTGNLVGNVTGTLFGNATGNAGTATNLQNVPGQCATSGSVLQSGINQDGSPASCGPVIRTAILGTGCTTGSSSFNTCFDSFTWAQGNFPTGNQVYTACQGSGSDARAAISSCGGNQTGGSIVTVTNGSVSVHENNITIIGIQFN